MSKVDADELKILELFDKGKLKSVATKSELEKFKATARATAIKDRRVNIRLVEKSQGMTSRSPRTPRKRATD